MKDQQIEEWARLVTAEDEGAADAERLFCEMANFLRKRHPELPSNIYVSVKNASHVLHLYTDKQASFGSSARFA